MEKKIIYFICPDMKAPTGGVKQIYKQVDLLNENGFTAFVVHKQRGFRCKWFENQTKIVYYKPLFTVLKRKLRHKPYNLFKKLFNDAMFFIQNITAKELDENSIMVFPEVYGGYITELKQKMKKVVYNQNCYYSFNANNLATNLPVPPYQHKDVLAAVVVSDDSKRYLEFAFKGFPVYKIRNGINTSLFKYNANKKKQIAFMPRKLGDDIVQVISILKLRDRLPGWEFAGISNKSESEVAAIMMESHIFLSFNQTEGFGLPPAEAMACGCVVIGYTGLGGDEYFDPAYSYPVADRNIIAFAEKIEEIAAEIDRGNTGVIAKGKAASEAISKKYDLASEKADTLSAWQSILEIEKAG